MRQHAELDKTRKVYSCLKRAWEMIHFPRSFLYRKFYAQAAEKRVWRASYFRTINQQIPTRIVYLLGKITAENICQKKYCINIHK